MHRRKHSSPTKRSKSPAKRSKRKRSDSDSSGSQKILAGQKLSRIMMGSGDVFRDMATVLNDLRQNGQLCDGVIKTQDGKNFKIHRAVVSASSPYFRALFTNTLSGVEANEVMVPSLTSEILTLILDYAYTRHIDITSSNVEKLLPAADLLQVAGVVQQCCSFLARELKIDNCIGIYAISKHYFCPALAEAAKSFIIDHFELISRLSVEFPLLPREDLKTILMSDDLNVCSECHVFEAIIRWTEHEPNERRQHLPGLLTAVRFGLCERSFVTSTVLTHPLLKSTPECKPCLLSIRVLHSEIKGKDMEDILNPHNPMCRPRVPNEVLFAIGGWSSEGTVALIETFDVRANRWFISDYRDNMPRAYHGIIALDNMIYMIGGFDGNQCFNSVRCFNPVAQVWSDRACMYKARCYVSVTSLNGLIYALGGYDGRLRTNSCERYDPKSNQWTIIASMNRERSDASSASFRDKVYIVGGFTGHEIMISAEVFDPKTGLWTYINTMHNPRSGVSLQATYSSLYVLGGFNGNGRMSSVERYDPERNVWIEISSMRTTRSNFATAVINGMLYVIGGFDGSTTIPSVEYYDEQSSEWMDGPPMNINRSALSACVLRGLPNTRQYTFLGNAA